MWTFLYRAAWSIARPFAGLLSAGDGKFARAVRGRRGGAEALARWAASSRDTKRPLVWFHAASVGEGRQAEAVMTPLCAAHPDWQIVYTHSSASAEKLAKSVRANFAGYLPFDTPADTAMALDALRPTALVFSATDLWPELIRQARTRGVKLGLVSGTMAPTSSRRGSAARALLHQAWRSLDLVGAISQRDADALVALGVEPGAIRVTGDTRHDSAAARAARLDRGTDLLSSLAAGRVIVAGSTWPGDESALFEALASLAAKPRLIIAPHEPSEAHLTAIEQHASRAGLSSSRLTRRSSTDVVIVDHVGILADLYAVAHIAFVGGGFHDAGLHSVIEPAALGVPVLFGPNWRSSRDAALLLESGGALSVSDADTLAAALRRWMDDETARATSGKAARAVVDQGLGAAQRSVALVEELMRKTGE